VQDPSQASRQRRTWPAYFVAVAAIVIAVASIFTNATLRSENAALRDRNALLVQRERTEAVRRNIDHGMLAALVAADAEHFPVQDGDVVRYRKTLLLVMHRLPPAPKGKIYQAWTQAHGSQALLPSVTFAPDPQGWVIVALPGSASADGVALSLEPYGGSKAPTSAPLFIRSLMST